MNYLVSPNPQNQEAMAFAARLMDEIAAKGGRAFALPEQARALNAACSWQGEALDCVIVLGGDGSILRQFHYMPNGCAPIWAVNFGHLGYLTDCEPNQALELLPRIMAGDYRVEKRTLLEGELLREGETAVRFRGLNEACIHRGAMNRAIRLQMLLNGVLLRALVADGLLLSTATGSTAYNYSAGGPLLTPEAEGLVMTPLCARWAENSSIVTAAGDHIEVRVSLPQEDADESDCPFLVIDGYKRIALREGDCVQVRGAKEKLHMIRTMNDSFCERLSRKLAALSHD